MGERDPFLTRGAPVGAGRYDGLPPEPRPTAVVGPPLPTGRRDRTAEVERLRKGAGARPGDHFPAESLVAMAVVPWAVFVMVACAYAFFPTEAAWRAAASVLAALCLAFAGLLLYVYFTRAYVSIYLHLGLLCILAVVLGWLVGNDVFQRHVLQHRLHQSRPKFTNVAPNDPASSFQDASTIAFDDTAKLDLQKVLGHHPQGGGTTYCVAPVLRKHEAIEVQFWAVGIDCCEPLWGFQCDDARKPAARSGVVVSVGESDYDSDMYKHFQRAAIQAAALYRLRTVDEPVFVRWVQDAGLEQQGGLRTGVTWIVGMSVLYFLVSMMVSIWLHWLTSYRRAGKG